MHFNYWNCGRKKPKNQILVVYFACLTNGISLFQHNFIINLIAEVEVKLHLYLPALRSSTLLSTL